MAFLAVLHHPATHSKIFNHKSSITSLQSKIFNRKPTTVTVPFSSTLPFAAVVGHPTVKRALLLLAIEPRLRGIAFAAPIGSAKSTLARSFAELVSDATGAKRAPFFVLPSNVSEDRLFGGIDIESAVTNGARRFQTGLLAQADGGFVFADNLNLLPSHVENALLSCLSDGRLRVERDGISLEQSADFSLIAAFNPEDGGVRWHVLDRLGLIVAAPRRPEFETRQQVLETVYAFERDPGAFHTLYADETTSLRDLVIGAKKRLPQVQIASEFLKKFCERAVELAIPGHRGELFASLCARANAALEGRVEVNEDDFKIADFFTLLPRATRIPEPPEEQPEPPPPPPPEQSDEDNDEPPPPPPDDLEDLALVFDTEDALLEFDFDVFSKKVRVGRYGKRSEQENYRSGRHVRSVAGDISQGRVAVEATLRQAAPHQRARRTARPDAGTGRILLTKDDVRLKKFRQRTGALLVFIVDASGSMAVNRMGQAKGAVVELLRQSYVSRDKVAMIGCYGNESRVLLSATQSVEAAKRQLEKLPTGGGTPLNDAMRRAHVLIDEVRRAGTYSESLVVILSDGRGNVLARPDDTVTNKSEQQSAIRKEMEDLARVYAAAGVKTVVIDTQNKFVSGGEAKNLAELFQGRYIYLPRLTAGQIAGAVKNELSR